MNRVHYEVNNLRNPEMKTQVKNALEKIDGVQQINVDLGRGTIEVGYNNRADESQIRDCIENVGCRCS